MGFEQRRGIRLQMRVGSDHPARLFDALGLAAIVGFQPIEWSGKGQEIGHATASISTGSTMRPAASRWRYRCIRSAAARARRGWSERPGLLPIPAAARPCTRIVSI
jgi:hypothetical protein